MQLRNLIRSTVLVMAISATGCASAPSKFDKLADTAQQHEYQETSTQDILNAYGNPLEINKREDGHIHFIYEAKDETATHWTNYIPVKALLFGFDTVEETVTTVFIFDGAHKLVETTINKHTVEHDYGIGNRRFYPSNMKKES